VGNLFTRKPASRLAAVGICAAMAVGGMVALGSGAAQAVTGPGVGDGISPGDIVVMVNPTASLADGQAITVSVTANNGITLNQITANQCADQPTNNFDFSVVGGHCASSPLSANHEWEKADGPYAPGTTTATFTYKVGTGNQDLTDLFTGAVRNLRCGPGSSPCLLGLWIQNSVQNDTFFFTPLTFGSAPPPTSTTTTTTVPSTTTTSVTVPSSTTTTSTTSTTLPVTTSTTSTTTVPETTSTTSTSTTVPGSTSTTSTTVPETTSTTTSPSTTSTTVPESTSTTSTTVPETTSTTSTSTTSTTVVSTTTTTSPRTTTTRADDHGGHHGFFLWLRKLLWFLFHCSFGK
jgi:hypothetical protein